jgi:hypothetical protein
MSGLRTSAAVAVHAAAAVFAEAAVLAAAAIVGVALLAAAALAIPAPASAQSTNPLSPGFPQPTVSIPTTTTAIPTISTGTAAGGGSGFSGSSAILIAIGAIVVLGGISLFIWRDARRRAPARHRASAVVAGAGGRQASKQRAKPRKLSPAERRRRKRGRAR